MGALVGLNVVEAGCWWVFVVLLDVAVVAIAVVVLVVDVAVVVVVVAVVVLVLVLVVVPLPSNLPEAHQGSKPLQSWGFSNSWAHSLEAAVHIATAITPTQVSAAAANAVTTATATATTTGVTSTTLAGLACTIVGSAQPMSSQPWDDCATTSRSMLHPHVHVVAAMVCTQPPEHPNG
jgi:hypothetical protein